MNNEEVFALTWAADDLFRREGIENRLPVLRKIDGPWTRLCAHVSWKEALKASEQPDFGETLAQFETDIANELSAFDKDERVVIADEVCSGAGWLLDPAVIKQVLIPLYKRMLAPIETSIGFHSDGNISELFEDLSDAGFSFVHLASVNYVELPTIVHNAQYNALTPYGGISSQTLEEGPLSNEIRAMLGELVSNEGLIVCDDAGMTTGQQLDAFLGELNAIPLY